MVGWDPAPDGEARMRRLVDAAWPALEEIGLAGGASRERLRYAGTLAEAVAGADFVQESAFESSAVKVELLAEIDAATPPEVVIASSTSGLDMSELQSQCARPERTVVGHPFNPVYMVPLVEVAPGRRTAEETVQWACRFYDAVGKSAVVCAAGLYGFLANRLQIAMFREALHMVVAGEATVEDLDRCISEGPGLRWAIMGPFLTFHLGGGEGGMRHFLEHMAREEWNAPYSRLDAPPAHRGAARAGRLGVATGSRRGGASRSSPMSATAASSRFAARSPKSAPGSRDSSQDPAGRAAACEGPGPASHGRAGLRSRRAGSVPARVPLLRQCLEERSQDLIRRYVASLPADRHCRPGPAALRHFPAQSP